MTAKLLAHTVEITGPDAIAFAHAQFSSRVNSLAIGQWQFSAWLDARGRVQSLFHLARCAEDTLILLLRGGDAATLAMALRRFVFRSRVSIVAAAPRQLGSGPALPLYSVHCGQDTLAFGCGDHTLHIGRDGNGDMRWRLQQLRAGWPWLPDMALDRWLAPDLSLQRLQAVVTDKGCYPGQEIVARLHFRGIHKNHLCNIHFPMEMHPGEQLRMDGRNAGCVLDVVATDTGFEALAVLDDEALRQIADRRLDVHVENSQIELRQAWPA